MDANLLKAQAYRRRAVEVRLIAAGIADPSCRMNLIGIAENYERLAWAIEAKAAHVISKAVH